MSSSVLNTAPQPEATDWAARLIPGMPSPVEVVRKKPRPTAKADIPNPKPRKVFAALGKLSLAGTLIDLVLPRPLTSRSARNWLRSVISDFAFVNLNWLLLATVLVRWAHTYETFVPLSIFGAGFVHAALITLIGFSEGLYAASTNLAQQTRTLAKSVFWATALLATTHSRLGIVPGEFPVFLSAALLQFAALFAWRWNEQARHRFSSENAEPQRNVLIVGANGLGRRVAAYLQSHPEEGRVFCGFVDADHPVGDGVIGCINDLGYLARTAFVDELVVATPHDRDVTLRVLNEARRLHLDVEIAPDLFGCTPQGIEIEQVGDLPLICLHAEKLPATALFVKRALDIVLATAALIVTAPLLTLIAALIKLDSKGAVLYLAQRVGRKGRRFRCYKFRTMVRNAEDLKQSLRSRNERSGPIFKIADDPRITAMGRFLRRYSLDELPQLWNVLRGEMSLVGPRPHPLDDFAAYEIEHLARLDVMPGITGLWQVTARRDSSFQKSMAIDREYIRNWSLAMDARILLKTVKAVLIGSGQ